VLTLEIARKVVAAAEAEAVRNNLAGVVAVVDDGGWPILIERMDHAAYLASVELAPGKARTAALFKKPSQALEDAINHGRVAAVTAQGFTEMQGGLPIVVDGEVIAPLGRASTRRNTTCKSRKPGWQRSLIELNRVPHRAGSNL
jgi:glc operon protein GlcG